MGLPNECWEALEVDLMAMHYRLDDIGRKLSWRQLISFTRHPPSDSVYLRAALAHVKQHELEEKQMHFGTSSYTIEEFNAKWAAYENENEGVSA